MNVRYVNHEEKGPGHGFFLCTGEDFVPGEYTVQLQRSVDHYWLAPDGSWDSSKVNVHLKGTVSKATLALALGPALVNALTTSDTYRLSLAHPVGGGISRAQLKIASILYSTEDTLNNALIVQNKDAPVPEEPELKEIEASPVEAPVIKKDVAAGGKKNLAFLAVILLLVLGALGYWYYQNLKNASDQERPVQQAEKEEKYTEPTPESSAETESPKPPAAPEQTAAPLPQAVQEEAPPAPEPAAEPVPAAEPAPAPTPTAPSAPVLSVEERVQRFFSSSERRAEDAARLAEELDHNNPSEQDAIFRLYYFAAENGDTSQLMDYAACLDPVKPAWGSIRKNALEAWRIYERARATHPEALEAQKALRTWLEERASKDPTAREWLARIPK